MSFAATGDTFCLRCDMALQGVKNVVKVFDDVLQYNADYSEHHPKAPQFRDHPQQEQICGRRTSGGLLSIQALRSLHRG